MKVKLMGLDIGECADFEELAHAYMYYDFKPSKDFLTRFPNFKYKCGDGYCLFIGLLKENVTFTVRDTLGDIIFNSIFIVETVKLEKLYSIDLEAI